MRPRLRRFLPALLMMPALAVGCAPAPKPPTGLEVQNTVEAAGALVRANVPMTTAQLTSSLGRPDQVVPVDGLRTFFAGQPGFDANTAEEALQGIYRGFLWSRSQRGIRATTAPGVERWSSEPAFLRCSVWLYRWTTPAEIVLSDAVSTRTGIIASDYFLIQDGLVIDAGSIKRRQ